jgi:hypothetical protein
MAGLLDAFGDDNTRFSLGLLAAAGPRFDGANDGQRIQEALMGMDAYKKQQAQSKMQQMQMEAYQAQAEQAKQEREQRARISAGMGQFFKQGQPALAPLMGDPSTGILPSNGRAAVAPSFDADGAASFLAQQGDYNGALGMMEKFKPAAVKLKNVEQMRDPQTGQLVNVALYENGETKVLPYGVKPDIQILGMGDRQQVVDKNAVQGGESFRMGQSPDSKASSAVAWANHSLSRERLNFDKMGGTEGVKPKLVGDQWVTAPSDMRAGEVRPAMPSAARKDANEALALIQSAREIIPKSTGSYFGAGVDQVGRVFGASTGGDTAAAQLKALEGALVSKMPKMSGPQSDKDVLLYKQMAGEIGDPTIPQSRKLAALQVIEQIQQRHSGAPAPSMNVTPTNAPTMRWNPKTNTLEMVK